MYNARRSLLPKLPKSMEETHDILKTFPVKTNKNEDFLMVNDIKNQIIMFSCSSNLEFLADLDTICIDGTFEYCPKAIHGLKEDQYIPLVFFLLPNKQKHAYTLALKYLTEQVEKCNKKLALRTVFAYFEEAIQQSVTEVWTNVSLKGCRFHLGQSWWRKIQALGLTSLYKDKESDVGKYLTYCFGMPFLNPEDVGDYFVEALSSIQSQNHRIVEFADYLVDNYLSESAKFPPEIWAEMSSSLQRTTNACESFHSRFDSSFYFAHPHIFQFLTVLIDFQSKTYVKIRNVK
uniref:Uncharacterized protein LOC114329322 n=1 Tax=Diabrotica virgifera virgifera TaxID=50390 RepID=A0A6P7FDT9_DIAVI